MAVLDTIKNKQNGFCGFAQLFLPTGLVIIKEKHFCAREYQAQPLLLFLQLHTSKNQVQVSFKPASMAANTTDRLFVISSRMDDVYRSVSMSQKWVKCPPTK